MSVVRACEWKVENNGSLGGAERYADTLLLFLGGDSSVAHLSLKLQFHSYTRYERKFIEQQVRKFQVETFISLPVEPV